MKKKIIQYLSNPKKVITLAAVIVALVEVFSYSHIGRAPEIPSSIIPSVSQSTIPAGSNVSLSFAQSGRVEAVLVKNADIVKKGDVLARLSAPQAQGTLNQARANLEVVKNQYASLNTQYETTKKQQDLIVENAYNTMLSSGLEGTANMQDSNTPVISGTYSCGKEGMYVLKPYSSGDSDSEFSFNYSGLENGTAGVKYNNSVPLGTCGLQVKFLHMTTFNPSVIWTINIPNTKSSMYLTNKNAYNLAVTTREKILADLSTTIGQDNTSSVAKAQIDVAQGAYEAALGAYQNNLIISPVDGIVTFIDTDLKVGQSITANKSVISINAQ